MWNASLQPCFDPFGFLRPEATEWRRLQPLGSFLGAQNVTDADNSQKHKRRFEFENMKL